MGYLDELRIRTEASAVVLKTFDHLARLANVLAGALRELIYTLDLVRASCLLNHQ